MLRSVIFTGWMIITIPFYAIPLLVAAPFSSSAAYTAGRGWARMVIKSLGVLCNLHWHAEGWENLPDTSEIIYSKHSSAWETIALLALLPRQCWVLKRELIWVPFFGWALAALRAIPIDRNAGSSAVDQVIREGQKRLAEGLWIMIFPEGTRMAAGETRRYGISGTLLAQKAGKLIVPIAHDAGFYWPRRGLLKRPGTIHMVIGKPVDPAGRDPREVNAEIQNWVECTVKELQTRT